MYYLVLVIELNCLGPPMTILQVHQVLCMFQCEPSRLENRKFLQMRLNLQRLSARRTRRLVLTSCETSRASVILCLQSLCLHQTRF